MKIKSLLLHNFRCFDNLEMFFDENLTVIVAANGGGKTAVLEGLVVALGPWLTAMPKASGVNFKETDIKVSVEPKATDFVGVQAKTIDGICWDRIKRNPLDKTSKSPPPDWTLKERQLKPYLEKLLAQSDSYPLIAYYPANRFASGSSKLPYNQYDVKWYDGYKNALDIKMNFSDLVVHMASLEDAQRREREKRKSFEYHSPALQIITKVLKTVLPEVSNFRTELRDQIVLVADFTDTNGGTTALTMAQLSSGYQAVLALVLDITLRMLALNHQSTDALKADGIVLIDEIDLHLHPKWQQQFIGQLRRIFPNIQFIITTHSPQAISTVASENIRLLHKGQVYDAPKGTKGAEASRILKRVFGVDSRPPDDENTLKLARYLKLVYEDNWTKDEAKSLRKQLDSTFAEEEPALTQADLYIENRQWEMEIEEDQ